MTTESPAPLEFRGRLFCRGGRLKGTSFDIDESATLGSADSNSCRIADPSVAEHHATISFDREASCYRIEDLGSGQPTLIDGTPVHGARALGRLHVITMGEIGFVFQQVAAPVEVPPTLSPQTEMLQGIPTIPVQFLSKKGQLAPPKWRLEVSIDETWHSFDLIEGENIVGRVGTDVVVPSREVSRTHAVIIVQEREVSLRDLGSTNSTFLNGERILDVVRVPLGAEISFGPLPARIVADN
ncbi:MAG: FHA domain-containing protein [Thermoanaerobaculia bacterium]|nr:FHA domain-containing protein [Thermoanaerobaculia bacterium]